jgi:hypothetical protein
VRLRVSVSQSMNTANGVSLMARRCAAMCFLMVGCADRSPGLRSYPRARGFICIVPGDVDRIACNRSIVPDAAPDELLHWLTVSLERCDSRNPGSEQERRVA